MDTAQVLIIRDAVEIIKGKIRTLIDNLGKLAEKYGGTVCMARTRGQLAVPITFGLKLNAWMLPLQRQLERLDEILKRVLQVQLGGAAGDLSAYKDKGQALVKALAMELGLSPASSWHAQRDNFSEFTNWLAMLTGILGKMGADILVMSQTEIDEVIENAEGGGKSSSMPHKNNPGVKRSIGGAVKVERYAAHAAIAKPCSCKRAGCHCVDIGMECNSADADQYRYCIESCNNNQYQNENKHGENEKQC